MGHSCVIHKERNIFCNFECLSVPIFITVIVFRIGVFICWPIAIIIVAKQIKMRNYFLQLALSPSSFSYIWGLALFATLFNVLLLTKGTTLSVAFIMNNWNCYKLGHLDHTIGPALSLAIVMMLVTSIVLVRRADIPQHLPVPTALVNLIRIITFKLISKKRSNRIIVTFVIWSSVCSIFGYLGYYGPITILAVLTDPYRNGFVFAAILLIACSTIAFLAAFVSLDQIFMINNSVAVHWREGLWRCLFWLFLATLALCGATFLLGIHCLILMDIRLPLRSSINFSWFFSVITTLLVPTVVLHLKNLISKLNNFVQ